MQLLTQELSGAESIKSRQTRQSVISAITSAREKLKLTLKPSHGWPTLTTDTLDTHTPDTLDTTDTDTTENRFLDADRILDQSLFKAGVTSHPQTLK